MPRTIQSIFLGLLLFPLAFLLSAETRAQRPSQRASGYSSSSNPLAWHNRKPNAAYWQQDVHYTIAARIDEEEHSITATETLEYVNNSPDTLREVFFHMYQNAFINVSYLRDLEKSNNVKAKLGAREAAGLGIGVTGMTVDGATPTLELDNTILKVTLPKPLRPGGSATFSMNFKTWYDRGSARRRMQMYDAWGWMHYNGCQWYPKMCVYDAHSGWNTDQHLGKEFYGDFGTFDVKLDFPSNYVVEATGVIQNRKEVLPDELREKLDVKNFKDKKWDEAPSVITPYVKGERKTWHFIGENVHDFAFTADPSYRLATAYWNGIECVGIAQEPHASGWQNSAELVARIVKIFSEDIGMYGYPKMVAADASDGMEYPMITMDGGRSPSYNGLLIHEIGHNWFYGMVGSNETYRAALDEGFTQFLTGWGMRKIDGDTPRIGKPKGWYRRLFKQEQPQTVLAQRVMNPYLNDALNRSHLPLETHSDDFHSALGHDGGYRQVYYKTATMLYNLEYLLGEDTFQRAMQHYFAQWKFAHPYFEDFRQSIIEYTGKNLNPFFDEWLLTTKNIDYAIKRVKRDGDSARITFKRRGDAVMPITFSTTDDDGARQTHTIPVQWLGGFTTRGDMPRWTGWGSMNKTYTATVATPNGLREVEIDPSRRLADAHQLDNIRKPGPGISRAVRLRADGGFAAPPANPHRYLLQWRPDVWWNPVDGVKAGLHVEGAYMNSWHNLDATVWWNTHFGQGEEFLVFENEGYYARHAPVNYTVNYSSPLLRTTPKLRLDIRSRFLDGLNRHQGGLQLNANARNTVSLYALTMWRHDSSQLDYLLYPQEWSSRHALPNSSINLAWRHTVNYRRGTGAYTFSVRAPFLAGLWDNTFSYSFAQLEAVNYNNLGKLELRTRFFARYGTGTNIPQESQLWLAGANPEALMENKYTRSIGFVPEERRGISRYETNNFQQGGGLNLRGYAGYLIADERYNGEVLIGYKGRSGASASVEADFDNYIPLRPKIFRNWLHFDLYAFADAGIIELSRYASAAEYFRTSPTDLFSDVRVDAGLGIAGTIKKWGPFEKAQPLTVRVDFPFLLNRPPFANPDYASFRWVVGVSRSF